MPSALLSEWGILWKEWLSENSCLHTQPSGNRLFWSGRFSHLPAFSSQSLLPNNGSSGVWISLCDYQQSGNFISWDRLWRKGDWILYPGISGT